MHSIMFVTLVGLTMFAGAVFAIITKKTKINGKANWMGLIAGIMLFTAFTEIIPHANEHFKTNNSLWMALFLSLGMGLSVLIDKYAPHYHGDENFDCHTFRLGVISLIAMGVHNLIEGVSLYVIYSESSQSGIAYGLGVIAHNIPIGFALAMPLLMSSKKNGKSMGIVLMSSLMTTVGGIIAMYLVSFEAMGVLLSMSAGMMIYSSIDTLIENSDGHNTHQIVYRVIIGMVLMGIVFALSGHTH